MLALTGGGDVPPEVVELSAAPGLALLTPAGDGRFAVIAEPQAPDAFAIMVWGHQGWQISVRQCADSSCDGGHATPLVHDVAPGAREVHVALRDDGAALLFVGDDQGYHLLTWST